MEVNIIHSIETDFEKKFSYESYIPQRCFIECLLEEGNVTVLRQYYDIEGNDFAGPLSPRSHSNQTYLNPSLFQIIHHFILTTNLKKLTVSPMVNAPPLTSGVIVQPTVNL